MSTDKFQNKYRIQSARYPFHDYNAGLYFITICTNSMEHYFGKITSPFTDAICTDVARRVSTQENEPIMHLTEIGKFADENLKQIQTHYPYCEIPLFVVMPNHIHFIIAIDNTDADCTDDDCRDAVRHVSTDNVPKTNQQIAQNRGLLSVVVGGFKSAVTRYANQNNISFKWQTRFYDHIIRDQNECNRIAEYIENNPYSWLQDKFYTE